MKIKCLLAAALASIALATQAGCSSGESRPPPMIVHIERQASQRAFLVKWQLPEPARAVVFTRGAAFRNSQWVPQGAGLQLFQKAGKDVLESEEPRSEFKVLIKEGFSEVSGDHALMTSFSDGGILLFTGHLEVSMIKCLKGCPDDIVTANANSSYPARLNFVPSPGESVLVSGAASASPVWTDASAEGVLAYFGKQRLKKGPGYKVIADPMLPDWIKAETEDILPQIIDLNSRRLKRSLPAEPVVFIPFIAGNRRFNSAYAGSVLSNQMILALYGSGWNTRSSETREQYLKLMAHEAFHLWNSSLYHSVQNPGGGWLHEGSADAFAYLSLLELGALTQSSFTYMHEEALNRCMIGLSTKSLAESNRSWNARSHYDCGAIVQAMLHRELRDRGSDLWRFWAILFDRANAGGGYYSADAFFELVKSEAPNSLSLGPIQELTSGKVKGHRDTGLPIESFFNRALRTVGFSVSIDDDQRPGWYARTVMERALALAIDNDCTIDGYFTSSESGVRLVGNPSCRYLKSDQDVSRVGRYSLWDEGVEAYDFLYKTCRLSSFVELTGDGRTIDFPCPQLSARPRYMTFDEAFGL